MIFDIDKDFMNHLGAFYLFDEGSIWNIPYAGYFFNAFNYSLGIMSIRKSNIYVLYMQAYTSLFFVNISLPAASFFLIRE